MWRNSCGGEAERCSKSLRRDGALGREPDGALGREPDGALGEDKLPSAPYRLVIKKHQRFISAGAGRHCRIQRVLNATLMKMCRVLGAC